MQIAFLKGYPDIVGKRRTFAGTGTGPVSYLAAGDPLIIPKYETYIDAVFGGTSVSGTYFVTAGPVGAAGSRQAWAIYWKVSSTGEPVAPGTNLSAETVQIGGFI